MNNLSSKFKIFLFSGLSILNWGSFSGILGFFVFFLHLMLMTPYELLETEKVIGTSFRLLLTSIFLCCSTITTAMILYSIAGIILSKLQSDDCFHTFKQTIAFFISFFPMTLSWVIFNGWNGKIDLIIIVVSITVMTLLVLLSYKLSLYINRFTFSKWTAIIYSVVSVTLVLLSICVFINDKRDWMIPLDEKTGNHSAESCASEYNIQKEHIGQSVNLPETVVFITIDTLRADHLGCYGYPRHTSPYLDRLSRENILFENMIAAASGTVPSMAALFTGISPEGNGVLHQADNIDRRFTTLAEYFQSAGFQTIGISSNPSLTRARGFGQGFEKYELIRMASSKEVVTKTNELLDTLSDKSLFLWVHFIDPHDPYTPPESMYRGFHSNLECESRILPIVQYGAFNGLRTKRIFGTDKVKRVEVTTQNITARYDGEIRYVDWGVGEVIRILKKKKRYEDALLFIVADHGETMIRGSTDVFFHHGFDTYNSCLHVPAILKVPGLVANSEQIVKRAGGHIDVLPALMRYAGLIERKIKHQFEGDGLFFEGNTDSIYLSQSAWWDGLSLKMMELNKRRVTHCIIKDDWKYIEYPRNELREARNFLEWLHVWRSLIFGYWKENELYDLDQDPEESRNLSKQEVGKVNELRQLIQKKLEKSQSQNREIVGEKQKMNEKLDTETLEQLKILGYMS